MRSIGRLRFVDVPAAASPRPAGTLVLLHGFPLDPSMWAPQHTLAERGWRIVIPELRGFGDGVKDPPTASIDDYAGDTIDLLDALHIEQAVIAGLSMGGYVAFALFRHAPRYFRGLVLADTRAEPDPPAAVEGRTRMQQLARERGQQAVADELIPKLVSEATMRSNPAVVDALRRMIVGNSVESIVGALTALMTRPDSGPTLGGIHCPTLIIVGQDDALTPPSFSEGMRKAIGGAELVVVPSAGHMSNMEQPQVFNEALARFLDHRV
jgi:pimeloyl-ACP methyl ester carboxylesterase